MKRIGYLVSKNSSDGMAVPSAYAQYFANFGLIVPINALDPVVNTNIDILILPGGADVNPDRYGGELSYFTQNPNIQLEKFDTRMLQQYIDADIPILGICRGFQTLNVHFGGSLSQDIVQDQSIKERGELVHEVTLCQNHPNFFNGVRAFKVNSLHHQGFFAQTAAENIIPVLQNRSHGNVEAFVVRGRRIAGVQWHPEEIYDPFTYQLIHTLMNQNEEITW